MIRESEAPVVTAVLGGSAPRKMPPGTSLRQGYVGQAAATTEDGDPGMCGAQLELTYFFGFPEESLRNPALAGYRNILFATFASFCSNSSPD